MHNKTIVTTGIAARPLRVHPILAACKYARPQVVVNAIIKIRVAITLTIVSSILYGVLDLGSELIDNGT